jgi:hypothetical protein
LNVRFLSFERVTGVVACFRVRRSPDATGPFAS